MWRKCINYENSFSELHFIIIGFIYSRAPFDIGYVWKIYTKIPTSTASISQGLISLISFFKYWLEVYIIPISKQVLWFNFFEFSRFVIILNSWILLVTQNPTCIFSSNYNQCYTLVKHIRVYLMIFYPPIY